MPGIGPLIKSAARAIMFDKIDVPNLRTIRKLMSQVRSVKQIASRVQVLRSKAQLLMDVLSNRIATYNRLKRQAGQFNKYVAELLLVTDYDVDNSIASIQIAYRELRMAAHHIVKGSEYKNYPKHFLRLAEMTKDGLWRSHGTMPCMVLFEELHGLPPDALKAAHKMQDPAMDLVGNFNIQLDAFIVNGKKTGSFTEPFELHQRFYRKMMDERFYKLKKFPALGGKSLDDWFDAMIVLTKKIDEEFANAVKP